MADIREDRRQLQQLLADIGQTAAALAPKDWTRAVVGYFLEGESEIPHQQIHILSMEDEDYVDIMEAAWDCDDYDEAIIDMEELCRKLRKLCAAAGDRWSSMTFSLTRNGLFNVDYSYDPIGDYDTRFILEWQSRYLI